MEEQLDNMASELEDSSDRLAQTEELTKELRECRRKCDELEEEVEDLKAIVDELEDANAKLKEEYRKALQYGKEMQRQKDEAERELETVVEGGEEEEEEEEVRL